MNLRVAGFAFLLICSAVQAERSEIESQIDAVFERYNQPDSPGAVVGVVKDGAVVFAKGYGMENIAAGKPLSPASRMNLGSTSKQFAAASIVLLAQDGKLSFDDDIRKWLPEMPDYGTPITIRHLIHHTSGLRDYLTLFNLAGITDETAFTNQDALDIAVRQKELNFKPGEEYLYCNTGYVLLAIIVERASGQTLTRFAQERIFAPLGMTHTVWDTDLSLFTEERALSYPTRGSGIAPANRLDVVEGDGNVMSTVGDLAKWDQNFYDPKVGGSTLIEQMLERGKLNNGEGMSYAFGLIHGTMLGRPIVEHGGSWLGFRAGFTRFPEERLSIIVLCNLASMNPDALTKEVAQIYLGEAEEPASAQIAQDDAASVRLKKKELKAKAGRYFVQDSGLLLNVEVDGDSLSIKGDGATTSLAAQDARTFRPVSRTLFAEIEFDAAGSDEPASIILKSANGRTQVARRVDDNAPFPTPAELAGTYYSPEIDTEYIIAVSNGLAEVTRPNTKPVTLEPIHGDWFRATFRYRFERDAAGNITGFRISAGRVKNILFTRKP